MKPELRRCTWRNNPNAVSGDGKGELLERSKDNIPNGVQSSLEQKQNLEDVAWVLMCDMSLSQGPKWPQHTEPGRAVAAGLEEGDKGGQRAAFPLVQSLLYKMEQGPDLLHNKLDASSSHLCALKIASEWVMSCVLTAVKGGTPHPRISWHWLM
jgi:hypothetical protein